MGKIILGIDPGYAILGWGVIQIHASAGLASEAPQSEGAPRGAIECLGFGTIQTSPSEEMGQRLAQICSELNKVIQKYQPDEIAIEELFFGKNARTAIKVAHARGVCLMCAVGHTGQIFEYKPANVKLAITGAGNAKKPHVQSMVQEILKLSELPVQDKNKVRSGQRGTKVPVLQDDAADALAVALAHNRLTGTARTG